MTAWETLKTEMTKGTDPGTCGAQKELIHAAEIFVKLLPYFKETRTGLAEFNTDEDAKMALLCRTGLREIGVDV